MNTEFNAEILRASSRKTFFELFDALRHANSEETHAETLRDWAPSKDIELRKFFHFAYPDPNDYVRLVFSPASDIALKAGLNIRLPAASVLTAQEEPVAGIGTNFFFRLLYLQRLAVQARIEVETEIEKRQTGLLPSLRLLNAPALINSLKKASTLAIIDRVTQKTPPETKNLLSSLKNTLTSFFSRVIDPLSQEHLLTGQVQEIRALTLGTKKFQRVATVLLSKQHENQPAQQIDLVLSGEDKHRIAKGDIIGFTGTNKLSDNRYSADIISIIVPTSIFSFLKFAEAQLNPFIDNYNSEINGSVIYGRVVSINDRTRTMMIRSAEGKTEVLDLINIAASYHLNQGDAFLAVPSGLSKGGIYKVSADNVIKLETPYAGRILSALAAKYESKSKKNLSADADLGQAPS